MPAECRCLSFDTFSSRYAASISDLNAFVDTLGLPLLRNHTGTIGSPSDFLKSIGRSAETKVKVEEWDELWKLGGPELKKQGLDVKDRR